jgi:hypothetical protein
MLTAGKSCRKAGRFEAALMRAIASGLSQGAEERNVFQRIVTSFAGSVSNANSLTERPGSCCCISGGIISSRSHNSTARATSCRSAVVKENPHILFHEKHVKNMRLSDATPTETVRSPFRKEQEYTSVH